MRKLPSIIILVFVLLLAAAMFIPKVAYYLGWRPTKQTALNYKDGRLGVGLNHPLATAKGKWMWREKPHDGPGGMILEIGNPEIAGYVSLVFFPAPSVPAKDWMEENRKGTGYYSNMKYGTFKHSSGEWVEETADYDNKVKQLRYYTVAVKHREHLIIMEACTRPDEFEAAVPFFQDLARSIRLYD